MISRESEKLLKWLYKNKDKPYTKEEIEEKRKLILPQSCYKNLEFEGHIDVTIREHKKIFDANTPDILQYTISDRGISYVEFPNWLFRKCKERYSAFALGLSIVAIMISLFSCAYKDSTNNEAPQAPTYHEHGDHLPPKPLC